MTKLTPTTIATYIIKIQLNFENAYVTSNNVERELLIASWYEALCEYPKEICDQAVNNALKKAKFAPRLGDLTEEIYNILSADAPTDEELWAELTSVLGRVYEISRYIGYPQYFRWANQKIAEIYSGLHEELKLYVVNASELIELAEMSDESLRFERTRFFKQLPVLKKHSANKIAAQQFLNQTKIQQALPKPKSDKNDN